MTEYYVLRDMDNRDAYATIRDNPFEIGQVDVW